ncbi:MAG: major capsid protein [Microbispora sp.]|nr:major capsid protein [Microbispora sp.]
MALSLYDTATLVAMVEQLKPPSNFLLDTFFPGVVTSNTEFVAVDVFVGKRRLAPFVSPLVEGKIVESLGMTTSQFKPAYIKAKTRLDPFRPIRRQIGEQIGGQNMTPAEREAQNLAFELAQQIQMVDRRLEWMAAQALVNGSVTISGENYDAQTINFGRDPSLTIALSGAAKWGQTGVYPSENLLDWSALPLKASGLAVTDVVFTPAAWKLFRKDPNVQDVIRSFANAEPSLRASGVQAQTGGQYLGNWGPFRLWLYFDWYIDPSDGQEKPMIPDGTVLMGSNQLNGTRAFASIIDPEVGYTALPYAPKSWTTQDPAARWLMTQSAPLVIPTQVNACLAATVV